MHAQSGAPPHMRTHPRPALLQRAPRPNRLPVRAALLLLLVALPAAGCGYRQDIPRLPGGARSLSVEAIRNYTDMGELDVRLRAHLRQRLAQQAHISLLPAAQGALVLSIDLDRFTLARTLDPTLAIERTFTYTLTGRLTRVDPRTGVRHLNGEAITVSAARAYPPVLETPAIRDEGINDLLAAFAEQVEQRLLRAF